MGDAGSHRFSDRIDLEQIAAELNALQKRADENAARSADDRLLIGELLLKVKQHLKERGLTRAFQNWIKENCCFTYETARIYMRVYEAFRDGRLKKTDICFPLTALLKQIKKGGAVGAFEPEAIDAERDFDCELAAALRRELSSDLYSKLVGRTMKSHWNSFGEALRYGRLLRPQLLPPQQRGCGLTDLFVDSGAFTAWNSGKPVDIHTYCDFLHKHPWITTYAGLDHIDPENPEEAAQISFENLVLMQEQGLNPVPVLHIGEDPSWLRRMLDRGCTYIGLSATSIPSERSAMAWYKEMWRDLVDDEYRPIVKVHAFGVADLNVLCAFPWASADSAKWANSQRFGTVPFSRLPHALLTEKGRRANAARAFEAVRANVRKEREVQRTNPDFRFFVAITDTPLALAVLRATGHYKALVSFPYMKGRYADHLRVFVDDPLAVLSKEPYRSRLEDLNEIKSQYGHLIR